MHFSPKTLAVLLYVVSLSLLPSASAESTNASVRGHVTDVQGLVIVGAEVDAVNRATDVVYSSKTNAEGIYSLPDLPPGTFEVHISKDGFRRMVRPDIALHVQYASALNPTLNIGAQAEIVRMDQGVSLIDSEGAAPSTTVDRNFAENLPLNGRSFKTLIVLAPGTILTAATAANNGCHLSVNGQRAEWGPRTRVLLIYGRTDPAPAPSEIGLEFWIFRAILIVEAMLFVLSMIIGFFSKYKHGLTNARTRRNITK